MIDWLKTEWNILASKYSEDKQLISSYWNEINKHYNSKSRYYHNVSHLYNMLIQIEDVKSLITDLDLCKFAIWYHDIIYKSTKKNNEEKSAEFAKKRLKAFNFDEKQLKTVEKLIKSTKKHELIITKNNDNAYILDLDLSILGSNWETYKKYLNNIRKEYAIYPDFMYKPGRQKVIAHFLQRDTLYFSEYFRNLYEKQARENLKKEIELL
ncbi:HD domain-containing protein [Psychroserpens mesophilus]|uniref:HD domain-containing protein n=1 Tax=Psychroserpens mesophilus TaxID=325473 RepID=UPI003D659838